MPETVVSLAVGMADDFNNILTMVMGACTLIDKGDPANGELLQYVALIRTSAERAADLSDRLMRVGAPVQKRSFCEPAWQEPCTATTSECDKKNC